MPVSLGLLGVQTIDLERDALIERRRTLPERESLRELQRRAASTDAAHVELGERRAALAASESEAAVRVEEIAEQAADLEGTLYSGSVKVAKELQAMQEEVALVSARQSDHEQQQMDLLEEIDRVEGEISANRATRAAIDQEAADASDAIARAEGVIDGELAELTDRWEAGRVGLPAAILEEYDRLRTKERLGGRAAAELTKGTCGACRVRLPVVEYNRIRAEPDDLLACCPRCGRVLVRSAQEATAR